MKFFIKALKSICLSVFGIYSVNILFSVLSIVVPINIFTIGLCSCLGFFGIVSFIVIELLI